MILIKETRILEERDKIAGERNGGGRVKREVRMKYGRARPLLLNYCIIVYCEEQSRTETSAT